MSGNRLQVHMEKVLSGTDSAVQCREAAHSKAPPCLYTESLLGKDRQQNKLLFKYLYKYSQYAPKVFNRPGVAGAVL